MMAPMSEAVWWLLTPSSLLVAFVCLGALAARAGARRLAGALLFPPLALLLALLALPLDRYLAAPLEDRHAAPSELPARVDGIVVLGGAVDWRVGQDRGQLSLDAAGERMLAALALARRYPEATLAFTGLFDDQLRLEWRDADGDGLLFAPELRGRRVVFLGEARSTYEEALLAIERLRPAPGSTWLLVTSALHMPRAYQTFRTQGWTLVPFPVDYRTERGVRPRLEAKVGERLAGLDRVAREWGAYLVYRVTERLVE